MAKAGEIRRTTNWVLLIRFDSPTRPWVVKKLKRSDQAEGKLRALAEKLRIELLD